jgi:hypothetical protein
MLNVFDSYGKIAIDPERDADAIAELSDAHRVVLFEMIDAVIDRDNCQTRVLEARKSVRELTEAYNASVMAYDKTKLEDQMKADAHRTPKQINNQQAKAIAAIKQVAAAQGPDYVSPKVKAPSKLKVAMDQAADELGKARAELFAATGQLRTLEIKAGAAIDAWRKCGTTPTAYEVAREYQRRSLDERAKNVAAGLPPHPVEPVSPRKSELDKVLGARGKTKTNRTPAYHGPR